MIMMSEISLTRLTMLGGPHAHLFLNLWPNGHRLKNSLNLSYDENKNRHRVRRPLISKYSLFQLNIVSEIFIFDFFPILTKNW